MVLGWSMHSEILVLDFQLHLLDATVRNKLECYVINYEIPVHSVKSQGFTARRIRVLRQGRTTPPYCESPPLHEYATGNLKSQPYHTIIVTNEAMTNCEHVILRESPFNGPAGSCTSAEYQSGRFWVMPLSIPDGSGSETAELFVLRYSAYIFMSIMKKKN